MVYVQKSHKQVKWSSTFTKKSWSKCLKSIKLENLNEVVNHLKKVCNVMYL